jgi:hypothetical protein
LGALAEITGTADSGLIVMTDWLSLTRSNATIVRRLSIDGRETVRYLEVQSPPGLAWVIRGDDTHFAIPLPNPVPSFAVDSDSNVYVSTGAEYEVLAFSPAAAMVWALRVDYPRQELPQSWIRDSVNILRQRVPDVRDGEIDFPAFLPAISGLAIDGHDHLYVFHHVLEQPIDPSHPPDPMRPSSLRPVDVYSTSGEPLFSGLTTLDGWLTASGDYIYRIEVDVESGEHVAARYQLLEPF